MSFYFKLQISYWHVMTRWAGLNLQRLRNIPMKFSMLYTAFFTGTLALSASAVRAQDDIEWDYNGRGRLAGNGCPLPADTLFIPAGNEFSIIFTKMTLELDEGPEHTMALNCRGRIPVRVKGNIVVEDVEQTLSYSYAKTKGSRGNIFARNTWFGSALANINQIFGPEIEAVDALREVRTRTRFTWACNPNTWTTGFLDLDFGLAAERNRPATEAISMNLMPNSDYKILVHTRPGC
jgi:hypothetical protein